VIEFRGWSKLYYYAQAGRVGVVKRGPKFDIIFSMCRSIGGYTQELAIRYPKPLLRQRQIFRRLNHLEVWIPSLSGGSTWHWRGGLAGSGNTAINPSPWCWRRFPGDVKNFLGEIHIYDIGIFNFLLREGLANIVYGQWSTGSAAARLIIANIYFLGGGRVMWARDPF